MWLTVIGFTFTEHMANFPRPHIWCHVFWGFYWSSVRSGEELNTAATGPMSYFVLNFAIEERSVWRRAAPSCCGAAPLVCMEAAVASSDRSGSGWVTQMQRRDSRVAGFCVAGSVFPASKDIWLTIVGPIVSMANHHCCLSPQRVLSGSNFGPTWWYACDSQLKERKTSAQGKSSPVGQLCVSFCCKLQPNFVLVVCDSSKKLSIYAPHPPENHTCRRLTLVSILLNPTISQVSCNKFETIQSMIVNGVGTQACEYHITASQVQCILALVSLNPASSCASNLHCCGYLLLVIFTVILPKQVIGFSVWKDI